jgi:hypothetical protein
MTYTYNEFGSIPDPGPPAGGNGKKKGKRVTTKKLSPKATNADPEAKDTDSQKHPDSDIKNP